MARFSMPVVPLVSRAVALVVVLVSATAVAAAPSTTTTPATGITPTVAVLNGTGSPNGEATTGWFRLSPTNPVTCNDTFGTRVPATSGTDLGTGTGAVPYSITTTGLSPGTTYYFCSIVQNASGTAFGAVLSFTTPAAPVVLTTGATNVGATSATLGGSANPVAATTTGWFRYSVTNPGTCNDTFGTRAPTSGGTNLGSGTSSVDYATGVSSLLPGTTYYYCAVAQNAQGTSFGSVLFFTTAPTAPIITTNTPTGVTTSAATLNGSGNPRGDTTVGWFRYSTTNPGSCNDTFGIRMPATGGVALGSGNTTATFSQALSGLALGTTYYYCAIGQNTVGTSFGVVTSFATDALPPDVTTVAASSLTGTGATLNAAATPNGDPTTGWFRYATTNPGTCNDTFGTRAPTSGGTALGSGLVSAPYSRAIGGLLPATTYYFCAIAGNSYGTGFGMVLSFTTPALPPTVTTATPTVTSGSTATLAGAANPNGDTTTGWFRYATTSPGTCNDTFGTRAPGSGGTNVGSGLASVAFMQPVTGLAPGTTYFFCAIGSNAMGTSFGSVLSFTTPAAPTVTTVSASPSDTSVTFDGSGNPNRAATTGWFRYATTNPGTCNDTFGSRAPTSGGSNLGVGSSVVGFNQTASGLSPGTTYYFCAIDQNSEGMAFGAVLQVTTLSGPSVTTNAATLVTSTSAQLNGAANPNGSSATGWFRYATVNPGTCNDTFGTRAPTSGGTSLGNTMMDIAYARSIGALVPATTYYYCAIASNSFGTGFGTVMSFTTAAALPVVATNSPTSVTGSSAQLNGSGTPGGDATTGWFRYATTSPGTCNDSFGTRAPASGGSALGSGTSSVAFAQAISGLAPNTTYFYCAIAQNSVGTGLGSVLSFTTPAPPTVVTDPAGPLTDTQATLAGTGNPMRAATTGWFRYSATNPGTCNDTFGSRAPITGGSNLGAGASGVSYAQTVNALSAGTTYYYCAIAQNSEGIAFGAVLSFTTSSTPAVTTNAATSVTATTATLNGAGDPNGSATTAWFRYATVNPGTCNDTFGTRTPTSGGTSLGSGTTDVTFTRAIGALVPATTYYYCAIAQNSFGTGFGSVVSFTTPALPPAVTTGAPTAVTGALATLNGTANPEGDATTAWFRFSTVSPGTCNDSFGTRAPATGGSALGAGTAAVAFAQNIMGLSQATTYYYCAIAQNSLGTSLGAVLSFATPAPPVVTTVGTSSLSSTSTFLDADVNPNRAATTGWFRYSATNPVTCNDTFGSRAPATGGTSVGAGSTTTSYELSIAGLSAGTTYYFCGIAQNSEGLAFGLVQSFTTLAAPTVTTNAATLVTANSATLNGAGDPNGASATGWFRYATTNPGTCNDTFGTRTPTSGGTALGSGTSPVAYARSIAGLLPATTYYVCALASNSFGTGVGAVVSFTTPALPPTVGTATATPVTGTMAQLNSTANPNGDATTAWFRFSTVSPGTCNDTFGTRAPITGGSAVGNGTSPVAYSQTISGLTQATTYFYCAIAQNSLGISFGVVETFTTAAPPVAVTVSSSGITSTTASLDGMANPNRAATTGWFRISATNPVTCNDTFGTRVPATGGTSLGAGSSQIGYSLLANGLSPATTYYFCAIAQNGEGTGLGNVLSFTTLATPTVTTNAATAITPTTATLNGMANPNGAAATGWFRYDTANPGTCNDSFGFRAPSSGGTSLGSGTADVSYARAITGLVPGATYYVCAIASNSVGTAFGAVQSFTTPPNVPTVTTNLPSGVTTTTATLNGAANPNGAATTAWFRMATVNPGTCDDTFGTRIPNTAGTALGAGNSSVTFSQSAPGITPGTTYFYCAIASNSAGTGFGVVRTFTTPATPSVSTLAATPVTATSATLNASANPNGNASTGWFRYSTVDPGACDDVFGTRSPNSGGTGLGAGTAPVSYSQALTGLAPATTYYFCALAASSIGTSFGAVLSFTTPPTSPVVTTVAATAVDTSSATLGATGNPNGQAATGYFRYATTNPGICNDTFGTRAPTSGGTSLGSSNLPVTYSQAVTGLAAGTTYFYCGIATNAQGTGFGAVMSFTTASAPAVTTAAATAIGTSTATLNGSANPDQLATTGWFRYDTTSPGTCNDTFGTRAPATGGTALGAGQAAVAYAQPLTGLTPATTYFACAIASNSAGTSVGTVVSFTTSAAPSVTTDVATSVAATSATLAGTANPNGTAATGWFRYATTNPGTCNDTFGTRAPTSGGTALGAGTIGVAYTRGITGLISGTTYYYCAIASNANGTAFGAIQSFTTAGAPTVVTDPATGITTTGATLGGTANPNQGTTTGWFRYATTNPVTCNDTFGTRAPTTGGAALGAGSSPVPWTQAVSGLAMGTTYYYCAIASNANGTRFGTVQQFSTGASAPTVTTSAASAITSSGATLAGSGNPGGAATTGWFRYATVSPGTCDDTFGTRAPTSGGTSLGSGTANVPFTRAITGLAAGTTYYFCAIAQNAQGTSFGSVLSFTTSAGAPVVTTSAPSAVGTTTATLAGTANPSGGTATGWFRYSATNPSTCNDTFGTRAPTTGGTALGAGTSPVSYSQAITGLSIGVTYYYCAIASNSAGTAFGTVQSFTTDAAAPSVNTVAATGTTGTTTTLGGAANPNSAATTAWFRYATTNPGTCDDTFGTRAPLAGGSAVGAGTTTVAYSQPVSGLTPATTYYFCAVAQNSAGVGVGSVLSFTTPAAPDVTTVAATNVNANDATLPGTAIPHGAPTTGWFRYAATDPGTCDDAFGTRAPATGGTALGSGNTAAPYSQAITGLTPITTYYYCAIAQNSEGTRFGQVLSFTTPTGPPTVTTLAPTSVAGDMATLNGSANPNGAASTGYFRYSATNPGTCNDTFGTRFPATGGTSLGGGTAAVAYSQALTGLVPQTTYYYCALATSSGGTGLGQVVSFIPGAIAPVVTTTAATNIDGSSAMIGGTANPNASPTNGWFRYGVTDPGTCSDAFGMATPTTNLGAGTTAAPFMTALAGLEAKQQYFYCAAASNAGGASFGSVMSFTTAAIPPVVTTVAPGITGTMVTLNGTANPEGAPATAWFRYAEVDPGTCNDTFGTRTAMTSDSDVGGGRAAVAFSRALADLAPGTYFACAIAKNEAGLAFGQVVTFDVTGSDDGGGGGCGCRTSSPGSPAAPLAVVVLVGFVVLRRRRTS
jgi:MYXO-CTERM domain-containing protein